jgi:hypothetical protein
VATSDELVRGLVDDAGLFPPEELGMAAAVARHRADQAAAIPVLTHRFVCPVGRFAELREHLTDRDRIELIALGPATWTTYQEIEAVLDDPRLMLRGFETVLPAAAAEREELLAVADALVARVPGLEVCVEVGIRPVHGTDLDLLAAHGHRAKVRCGGVRREMFPSAAELAAFLVAAAERGLPFKATAGLHHAITHTDGTTGFGHFGFLDLIAGTARALAGAPVAEVEAALLERDRATVVEATAGLAAATAREVRDLFRSFGSCSTSEPVDDLAALGLFSTVTAFHHRI